HIRHVALQLDKWTQGHATSKELSSLLLPTAAYLERQGLFEGVERLGKLSLSISMKVNGRDHIDTAEAFDNLSYFSTNQNDFSTAKLYSTEALKIRKKILDLRHDDTTANLHNLAYIYGKLGAKAEAATLS